MSEAELHVLRARLNGGIRNKAARGELRRGLPVGFVWGEADGEVCFHPDEAVVTAIRTVFARFAETGSARRVWLWFRSEGLTFPLQMHQGGEIRWVEASYTAIHHVLTNPVYAGAYAYGKTRQETTLDAAGARKKRIRHLPRSEWQVLIPDHHQGFIDWQTYEANQDRIASNTRPRPTSRSRRREGGQRPAARPRLLRPLRPPLAHALSRSQFVAGVPLSGQGSGRGPRRLLPQYRRHPDRRGRHPRLHRRPGAGRARRHTRRRRAARERPRGRAEAVAARRWSGPATKRNAPSVDTVPSIQTTGWSLAASNANGRSACAHSKPQRPSLNAANGSGHGCSPQSERNRLLALGPDLAAVWHAATTTPRDRKELLRTLARRSHRQGRARQGGRATSRCAGKAARSTGSTWRCRARGRPPYAPTRTRSRSFADWPSITPTP